MVKVNFYALVSIGLPEHLAFLNVGKGIYLQIIFKVVYVFKRCQIWDMALTVSVIIHSNPYSKQLIALW